MRRRTDAHSESQCLRSSGAISTTCADLDHVCGRDWLCNSDWGTTSASDHRQSGFSRSWRAWLLHTSPSWRSRSAISPVSGQREPMTPVSGPLGSDVAPPASALSGTRSCTIVTIAMAPSTAAAPTKIRRALRRDRGPSWRLVRQARSSRTGPRGFPPTRESDGRDACGPSSSRRKRAVRGETVRS